MSFCFSVLYAIRSFRLEYNSQRPCLIGFLAGSLNKLHLESARINPPGKSSEYPVKTNSLICVYGSCLG